MSRFGIWPSDEAFDDDPEPDFEAEEQQAEIHEAIVDEGADALVNWQLDCAEADAAAGEFDPDIADWPDDGHPIWAPGPFDDPLERLT